MQFNTTPSGLAAIREYAEQGEAERLSPRAALSARSKGRAFPEPPDDLRTEFQRDRDRVIHTNAFRRLKHKTQVFIAPVGDHFVTRLTHTLEVTQIARTIARALRLNEDLVEAAALGHDLGHTPFGHIGEQTLDRLRPNGFRHNEQSLRTVDILEKDGVGLNLTFETRQAILRHSKPRGNFLDYRDIDRLTLEAQAVRVSDAIAYLAHDIDDAIRAGVIGESDLPAGPREILGRRRSQRLDVMVRDIVTASTELAAALPNSPPRLVMSSDVLRVVTELREFMYDSVYAPAGDGPEGHAARAIVELLYHHLLSHPHEIPERYHNSADSADSPDRAAVDYIAGMTDSFALALAERLRPGVASNAFAGRL